MASHILHRCSRDGCFNEDHGCHICRGGLALCTVCGGAEAAMPKECPGRRMTGTELEYVQAGMLDFKGGEWKGAAHGQNPC